MATRRRSAADESASPEAGEQQAGGWENPVVPRPSRPPALPPEDDEVLEPGQRIAEMLRSGAVSDEDHVRVYKRLPNSIKFAWCKNYTAPEFLNGDLQLIRDEWGPGEYSLRIYGGGRLVREDVTISAPLNVQVNPSQPQQSQQSSILETVLAKMSEQNALILQALSNRPDTRTEMLQNLELLKTMREAMGIGAPAAPAVAAAPAPSLADSLIELRKVVQTVKEMSGELNPEGRAPEESLIGMGSKVLDMLASRMGTPAPAALPQMALPPSLSETATQHAQNPAQENTDMGLIIVKSVLAEFLAIKQRGGSPAEGGDFIAEKLPEDLLPYLSLPNWFEIACGFAPELKAHEQWVRESTAEALRILNSQEG